MDGGGASLPRRCPGVSAPGLQMPGVRLGALPDRFWGRLNLDLEGALFGLFKGQRDREARVKAPAKAGQGVESLTPSRSGGRLEDRARSPRTKTGGPVGFTHDAQRCPKDLGGLGREQTLQRRRAGKPAGGFPRASVPLHLPAHPPPSLLPPQLPPAPARLCSLRRSSPLPSAFSRLHCSPTFLLFFLRCLLLYSLLPRRLGCFSPPPGRREEVSALRPGPAAPREALLPLLPGNLERLCVRARECKAKRCWTQRRAERARVSDIPHQLHSHE